LDKPESYVKDGSNLTEEEKESLLLFLEKVAGPRESAQYAFNRAVATGLKHYLALVLFHNGNAHGIVSLRFHPFDRAVQVDDLRALTLRAFEKEKGHSIAAELSLHAINAARESGAETIGGLMTRAGTRFVERHERSHALKISSPESVRKEAIVAIPIESISRKPRLPFVK